MRKLLMFVATAGALGAATSTEDRQKLDERLNNAVTVFDEIMAAPDKGIPEDLLAGAHCAVIVPGLKKGAFIVGGQYGKGFMTCRNAANTGWSAPAAIRVEGGSYGFQIGGEENDVVMLVMNDEGAQKLMQDKFTLGGEASAAAGPIGRTSTAQTDLKLTAGILSWARTRGAFAGVALNGATLRSDQDDNELMYGKKVGTREVVEGKFMPTPEGRKLIQALSKYSRREK